ncbi:MAG TPA: hypothetical protein GX747_04675 [Tenericutes bacterium]|nr:hypothetical protein [Mycoplasmatota bacterium]
MKILDVLEKSNNNYKTREFRGESQLGEIIYNIFEQYANSGNMSLEKNEQIMNYLPSENMFSDEKIAYTGLNEKVEQISKYFKEYALNKNLENDNALVKKAS